jgi:hypothetical protein
MNLTRIIDTEDVDIDIDEKDITDFYKKHWKAIEKKSSRRWNGRQIKNAFQSALALANWDFRNNSSSKSTRPSLNASHFKKVTKTSDHFDDDLADTFREGEDRHANTYAVIVKREGLRNGGDRGLRAHKRHDRDGDSSSGSASSDSDQTKRKHFKKDKEKKKSKSKSKKTQLSESGSSSSASDSEGKTESSDSESEKRRLIRKAAEKDAKKSKSKSKQKARNGSDQEDASGGD